MKKLLIIQMDGVYFLEETLRVLEKCHLSFKDFELTLLVSPDILKEINHSDSPLITGITTDTKAVSETGYDLSFNLSMQESTWEYYGKINSARKLGPFIRDGKLNVPDLWSTFLLTIKSGPPFLTFHLQDIYRNILGIKKMNWNVPKIYPFKEIVFGNFNETFISLDEREKLITAVHQHYPNLRLKNVLDVDLISDLSSTLYIGPATIEALRVGESGARCLYVCRNFQGFNILPHDGIHYVISSRGHTLSAQDLLNVVEGTIQEGKPQLSPNYSLYEIDHENLYGAYLRSLNQSDSTYPVYQAHVVLWNFLLNLFDLNLDICKCSEEQMSLLKDSQKVLSKLVDLHSYALKSVDIVYQESKFATSNAEKIEGHLKNLREIDEVMAKISNSQPFLRPFLDFYRIRRGQNEGSNLTEQVQHTFLTYSEENHALNALNELFSVTLRKNEVSI